MITTFKGLADGLANTTNIGLLPLSDLQTWTPIVDIAKRTGVPTIMVNKNMFELASEFSMDCSFQTIDPFYKRTAQYILREWVRNNDLNDAKLLEGFNDNEFTQMLWIGRIPDYNGGEDYYLYFGRMKPEDENQPPSFLRSWGGSREDSDKSPSIIYGIRMAKCAGAAGTLTPNQNFQNALKIASSLVDFEKTSMDAFSTSTVEMLPTSQEFVKQIHSLLKNIDQSSQSTTNPTDVSFVRMKARRFEKDFLEVDAGGVKLDVHPIMKKFISYDGTVTFYLAQLAYDPIFVWIRENPSMLQIWETAVEIMESSSGEDTPTADIKLSDSTIIPIEISTFSLLPSPVVKMQEIAEIYEKAYNTAFPKDGFIRIRFGLLPDWAKEYLKNPKRDQTNNDGANEKSQDNSPNDTAVDDKFTITLKNIEEEKEKFNTQINEQGWKDAFEKQTSGNNWRMHSVVRASNEKIKELNLATELAKNATYKNISDLENIPKNIRMRVENYAIYLGEVDKIHWYILQEKDSSNVFYLFKSETLLNTTDRVEMNNDERLKAYEAVLAAKNKGNFMHADYLK